MVVFMEPIKTDIIDLRIIEGLDWQSLYSEIRSLETKVLEKLKNKKKMVQEINSGLSQFLGDLKSLLSDSDIYDRCSIDTESFIGHSVDMDWRIFDNAVYTAIVGKIGMIRTVPIDDQEFKVDIRGIFDETFEIVYENMRPGMVKFLSIPEGFDPPDENASDHEWLSYKQGLKNERVSSLVQALDFTDSLSRRAGEIAQRYLMGEICGGNNPYSHLIELLKKGVITTWTIENIPEYSKYSRMEAYVLTEAKRGPRVVKLKHNDPTFSEEIIKYPKSL